MALLEVVSSVVEETLVYRTDRQASRLWRWGPKESAKQESEAEKTVVVLIKRATVRSDGRNSDGCRLGAVKESESEQKSVKN